MKPQKTTKKLLYQQQTLLLKEFLQKFQDYSVSQTQQCYQKLGYRKYKIQLQKIANFESKIIQISIEDLESYFRKDEEKQMVRLFRANTLRYIHMFQKIISQMIPARTKQLNPQEEIQQKYSGQLKQQRIQNYKLKPVQQRAQNQIIPFKIDQFYDVVIVMNNRDPVQNIQKIEAENFNENGLLKNKSSLKYSNIKGLPIRTISQITAQNIGQLIITKAIVVRQTEVFPQLEVATYACDICGNQNYQNVNDSQFTPLKMCGSAKCVENKSMGKLIFLPTHSKFRSYQQLKIQQTPEQLKRGSIPKSISVELHGHLVNKANPGDIVRIQGIVLPRSRSLNPLYRDLSFDTYIYVTRIQKEKKKYVDFQISQETREKIMKQRQINSQKQQQLFKKLANSIAPQIYGLQHVKKALLLQMVGGNTIKMQDGLRIRGQINIALFGDPGIAKSQLLKHISHISPRSVYTTGKGSSGVGLTAAIISDPRTKQLSLEAGALVLADMGVCCIDQFDKMDQYDRTAIHEVMQQQTVSITKAGIITTLNARTAILAAANPFYGRYNKKQSTQKNLNLPAALLSRFDLIFILLDSSDPQRDRELAIHIGTVHKQKRAITKTPIYQTQFLKSYIAMARQYNPIIPVQLHDEIINRYTQKRLVQMDVSKQGDSYTTMRSLLGIIRLSQARAKLRFSNQVSLVDIIQSFQIISESQQSVSIEDTGKKFKTDNISQCFELIKSLCLYSTQKSIEKKKASDRAIAKGFGSDLFEQTLKQYCNLGVVILTQNDIIRLVR